MITGIRMSIVAMILVSLGVNCTAQADTAWLTELDLSKMSSGWGRPLADQSVTGKALSIGGRVFEHGVGTHADSMLYVDLDGKVERFQASVGVDDAAGGRGTVAFRVYGDGKSLFDSGVMKGGQEAKIVDVSLSGVRRLMLLAGSAGDGADFDHANWAQARFVFAGEKPQAVDAPKPPAEEKVILTPETRAAAANQRTESLRRPAGTSFPLSHPLHGNPPDSVCGRSVCRKAFDSMRTPASSKDARRPNAANTPSP